MCQYVNFKRRKRLTETSLSIPEEMPKHTQKKLMTGSNTVLETDGEFFMGVSLLFK